MKRKYLFLVIVAGLAVLAEGCAKVYSAPDAKSRAGSHRMIAVVPPNVSIAAQRKVDAEAIVEQQKTESMNFQREMHSWMLRRKMQGKIRVDMLDVQTTNARLQKAGFFDGTYLTPDELCEVLEVDGIITSNYSLSKPMSEGAAIAVGLLVGIWGSTNEATVALDIHDRETNRMIWNYSHKLSGSAFSTPAQLVDGLMRKASKKMPYVSR